MKYFERVKYFLGYLIFLIYYAEKPTTIEPKLLEKRCVFARNKIYTRFATFAKPYFPNFAKLRNQSLQFY